MSKDSSSESFQRGVQLLDSGKYEAARECFEGNLNTSSKGSSEFANSLLFLGLSELKLDHLEAARKALEKAETAYGKLSSKHEELSTAMTRHAEALTALDETGLAEEKLDQALNLARESSGPYSVQVADTIAAQGTNLLKKNEVDEAEKKLAKSFGMRKGLLGAKHSEVAQSMNQLSSCYSQADKYAPAEVMAKQALSMQESIIGVEHPDYGITLFNLATVYVKQGRMLKAEPFARDAHDLLTEKLPGDHSMNVWALDRLGSVMLSTNKNSEAKELYNKALLISQGKWGKDSANTVGSLIGLGLSNLNLGDYKSAERYLSIALDLMQHSPQLDTTIEYSILQQLACSYVFQLKLGDAIRLVPDSLRARHTSNFNESIDMLNKVVSFLGSQVDRLKN